MCCLMFSELFIFIVSVGSQQTAPDNALGPRTPNCPAGFMDITRGNAYWWECGVAGGCPGNEPWTKLHCGCACVTPAEYHAFWITTQAPSVPTPAPTTQAPGVTGSWVPNVNPPVPVVTQQPGQATQQPNSGLGNTGTSGSGSGQTQGQQSSNGGNGVPGFGANSGTSNSGANGNGEGGILISGGTLSPSVSATTDDDGNSTVAIALVIILTVLFFICIIVLVVIAYVKGIIHPKIYDQFKVYPEANIEEGDTVPDTVDPEAEAERAQQLVNDLKLQLENNGLLQSQESAFKQPPVMQVDVSPRGAEQRAIADARHASITSGRSNNSSGDANSLRPSQRSNDGRRPSLNSNVSQVSRNSQRSQNPSPRASPTTVQASPRGVRSPSPRAAINSLGINPVGLSNERNLSPSPRGSPRASAGGVTKIPSDGSRRGDITNINSNGSKRSDNILAQNPSPRVSPTAVQASPRGVRSPSPRAAINPLGTSPVGLSNERNLSPSPRGSPRASVGGVTKIPSDGSRRGNITSINSNGSKRSGNNLAQNSVSRGTDPH